MIEGQKIVAFTPCGRKRYMDLLVPHIIAAHERGQIDEWVLFNNPYTIEDEYYAAQVAQHLPWAKVLNVGERTASRGAHQIASFYGTMSQQCGADCIYLRIDDDLCYIDPIAITLLVKYRLANPDPFLVYPTIINNTRTSFQLQAQNRIPYQWGTVEPILCAPMAWINSQFVFRLHQKALAAIENGTLIEEFELRSENFADIETGNISINCFAMLGKDMVACDVARGEEEYLSRHRPQALGRFNARCGNAIVIHFAYHTQTVFMDQSGMLTDYARLGPPMPFRTHREPPIIVDHRPEATIAVANPPMSARQLATIRRAAMARQMGIGLKA